MTVNPVGTAADGILFVLVVLLTWEAVQRVRAWRAKRKEAGSPEGGRSHD